LRPKNELPRRKRTEYQPQKAKARYASSARGINPKEIKKKRKRKKLRLKEVVKWFFIFLACSILIIGIVARIYHFFTVHVK
jgi:hypothetical protein